MSSFPINPDIIPWALQRLRLSRADFAHVLGTSENVVKAWESGEKKPTGKQAQEIADRLFIPLGYLALNELPDISLDAVDFRTQGNHQLKEPSQELWATYNNAAYRQEWYKEYAIENEYEPCDFVGSMSMETPIGMAASRIREILRLNDEDMAAYGNWEDYFSGLIYAMEETAGVMVMRNSVVGNNSHRPLSVEEFRGFAIADPIAPLIYINTRDSRNAQLFTLIHEFVHLLIGHGGISGNDLLEKASNKVERYCNQVAAEFLVPEESLRQNWPDEMRGIEELHKVIKKLGKRFHVSGMVMIIRCRYLDLISELVASQLWEKELAAIQKAKENSSGGGDPYKTMLNRISPLFARTIIYQAEADEIQLGDAYDLLNVKNHKAMKKLAQRLGID